MYTIFGGNGFIGSNLINKLNEENRLYRIINRHDVIPQENLGHIIYCIGITSDFRTRPYDTVQAHVCHLMNILKKCSFESFTYLSSTRIYKYCDDICDENSLIKVNPIEKDDLYNISKIMGESLCMASRKNVNIIRLSNVYGVDLESNNFLSSVIKDAILKKKVIFHSSKESNKDYVFIGDAVNMIIKIIQKKSYSIYNIASGKNITNDQIIKIIKEITNCDFIIRSQSKKVIFPIISIEKIKEEFGFCPSNLLNDLEGIISEYIQILGDKY